MDTWVWVALAVVVVLALVASVVDGWGRGAPPDRARRRAGGRLRPPGRAGERPRPGPRGRTRPRPAVRPGKRAGERSAGPVPAPRAREIWWADVPFEDGPGSKDRPCLVLSVRGGSARVVKITSRDRGGRPGVVELPPGSVGDRSGRRSYLTPDELRDVPLAEFRRRVGEVDGSVWSRVRHLAG
ncbi:type II toxin-antitoxin system PemK/MazF family toxin [Streptomyces sp. F63]|uniref:type II toxin-antitoxin system PemK/MazF family toxin n=1 Tax=Streptomyces sp. F63 TaxID=2824887 RepID=UPI001B3666B8|nr:type II toxin-antitoxin system PemK/MazF family toxin [Streptomyces sp. F63]MBQ0988356.1 type II toxin-antitoxin system PemK/MazF family toxin [Streptomyces sp. F63]